MLFNSYAFLLVFLPLTMAGFFLLSRFALRKTACAWLGLASVFFYGYWSPEYIVLLLGSIVFNYVVGSVVSRGIARNRRQFAKIILIVGISGNLLLLGYYKYANFFLDTAEALNLLPPVALDVVLPIGISFFTFTQIAFIVDCYEGKVSESDPAYYLLFVTYFPHLIAGPVLHHGEMMPQFAERRTYRWVSENVITGAVFFVIGLMKKVVFADGIQPYVGPVFDGNQAVGLVAAWGGALAYTLQLYFDFSGYSDMAIGLSKIFNVNLPLNFNSPYKARNISEFWRRWHMTLSRFLRDYLYIRLGGNRYGPFRRYFSLMVTMLLGGLWHGAGWTFVIWGGLHGCYLVLNHGWLAFKARALERALDYVPEAVGASFARALTLLMVIVAWVFFRAHDVDDALRVFSGMVGLNGSGVSPVLASPWWMDPGELRQLTYIALLMGVAVFCPNSQQLVARFVQRGDGQGVAQRGNVRWFVVGVLLWVTAIVMLINGSRGASEFIYFNF